MIYHLNGAFNVFCSPVITITVNLAMYRSPIACNCRLSSCNCYWTWHQSLRDCGPKIDRIADDSQAQAQHILQKILYMYIYILILFSYYNILIYVYTICVHIYICIMMLNHNYPYIHVRLEATTFLGNLSLKSIKFDRLVTV